MLVDGRIDAADEEAGDAANLGDVATGLRQLRKPRQIGLDHLLVDGDGEEQRDVDIQSLADQALDRGNAPPASPAPSPSGWGRSTAFQRRSASSTVASVSLAR